MNGLAGSYEVRLLHQPTNDPDFANVDVVVEFASGRRFGATFFTIDNIKVLMDRYAQSGECAQGLYLWAADMIIIRSLGHDIIRTAVADLIESGEFGRAFSELTSS